MIAKLERHKIHVLKIKKQGPNTEPLNQWVQQYKMNQPQQHHRLRIKYGLKRASLFHCFLTVGVYIWHSDCLW